MNKRLVVFSIIVSLFILSGLSLVEANAGSGLHTYGGNRVPTNTSLGSVCGSTCRLNFHNGNNSAASPVWNITVYYNTSGGASKSWATATLASVASNTTCSSNICNKTGSALGGASFLVDWTPPSTNGATVLVVKYRWRNGTNLNSSLNALVSVDTTAPTISFAGNVTDAFVFTSLSRFTQGYPAEDRLFLAKVTDQHVWNCSLYSEAVFNGKVSQNRTRTTPNYNNDDIYGTNAYNVTVATRPSTLFYNLSLHWNTIPNNKYTWRAVCYDNATVPNRAATANRTFFMDNSSPTFPATNPFWFDDSDKDSTDDSRSGRFRIGGVWVTEVAETVTMHCDAVDATEIGTVDYYVKRPGGDNFVLEGDEKGKTFDFRATTKIGTYEAYCVAKDIATNASTSATVKFKIQAEDVGDVAEEAPSGAKFDINIAEEDTVSSGYQKGRIATLTFDGITEHTVTFDDITDNTVTLTIKSLPITLTLSVGQSKDVDVNDDGLNDLSVTLKGIVSGTAQVDFKKLEGAASVETPKITTPTTQPRVTPPTTEAKSSSAIGIWIVVIIVVVGLAAYFIFFRKKKQ